MGLFGKSKRDAKLAEEMAPYILSASDLPGARISVISTVLGKVMNGDYTVVPYPANSKLSTVPLSSDELNSMANESPTITGYVFFNPADLEQTMLPPSVEEFGINIFHVGCDYLCKHQLSAIAPAIEKRIISGKGSGIKPPTLCKSDAEVAKNGDPVSAIKLFWPELAAFIHEVDATFVKEMLNHQLFDVSGTYQEYTGATPVPYTAWIIIA